MPKKHYRMFSWLYTPLPPISEWWLARIIVDETGYPSSKRIMGLLSGFSIIFAFLWNVTNPTMKLDHVLVEAMMWICVGCLGLSTADKFSPSAKLLAQSDAKMKELIQPEKEPDEDTDDDEDVIR